MTQLTPMTHEKKTLLRKIFFKLFVTRCVSIVTIQSILFCLAGFFNAILLMEIIGFFYLVTGPISLYLTACTFHSVLKNMEGKGDIALYEGPLPFDYQSNNIKITSVMKLICFKFSFIYVVTFLGLLSMFSFTSMFSRFFIVPLSCFPIAAALCYFITKLMRTGVQKPSEYKPRRREDPFAYLNDPGDLRNTFGTTNPSSPNAISPMRSTHHYDDY